jgi:Uma2 family endonuclease
MAITEQRLTLEEFMKLPEEKPALEFMDGMVTQKVSPQGLHSTLQARVIERINRFSEPLRLAFAFPELRTTFGGFSPVPDVAVYVWHRIPLDSAGRPVNRFTDPPDIAVEIVSPEQRVNTLVRRCLWYVANGVRIALLIDPDDESIIVFRPDVSPLALGGSERIGLDEVLPGFELTVQELFDSLSFR